jgi:hypothetical protein
MKSLLLVAALAAAAHADDKTKAAAHALSSAMNITSGDTTNLPPLILIDSETKNKEVFIYGDGSPDGELMHVNVGLAGDGRVAWVAADSGAIPVCGKEGCDKLLRKAAREAQVNPPYHHPGLVEDGKLVFIHSGRTGNGVGYVDDLTADISDDAKPIVDQFQKSIADPKAFAATVSTRKDAFMYGTEPNERFLGGAAVKATLLKWGLSLSVHGGIHAGVTKSKTVAWVAADIDARTAKSKKTSEYRLTVIYEKTGTEWKIVQIHFS